MRKLARELDRSPEDLLSLLRDELVLPRFKSADDMVPDDVVVQLRRVAKKVPPRALGAPAAASRKTPTGPAPGDAVDAMAALVPGVQKVGAPAPPRKVKPVPSPGGRAGPAGATLADERQLDARAALAEERRKLEAARSELVAARAALAAEREAVEGARAALETERASATVERAEREADLARRSLQGLLDQRGLKGVDEHGRALAALAQSGALGKMASTLIPADPDAVRRLLQERLVLAAGPVPESVGAVVLVSPDRADLRGGAELDRALARLSEGWLLDGRRRVVLCGLPPRFHGLLRDRLDRRVELVFRPGGERDARGAQEDLAKGDLVVLWNVESSPAAKDVYAGARARVVDVAAKNFSEFLERLGQHRPVA